MKSFSPHDAMPTLEWLTHFIGLDRLTKSVDSWLNAAKVSQRHTKHYYLEQAFPWWRAFDEYRIGQSRGQIPLTPRLIHLVKDGIITRRVIEDMPESVQNKFASALGSSENAPAAFFEITIAHQFHELGYKLTWCEDTGDGRPMPEFLATKTSSTFEVECKQISFDTGRHITRLDFLLFADLLEPYLRALPLTGRVDVTLNDKQLAKPQNRQQIANDIRDAASAGKCGELVFSWGTACLQLVPHDQVTVDFVALFNAEQELKNNHAHSIITAASHPQTGAAIHPQTISVKSNEPEDVLGSAFKTLATAAKRQLSGERPGILCLFLPEIYDYTTIADSPDLQGKIDELFGSESRTHVAAVVLSSHDRVRQLDNGEVYFDRSAFSRRSSQCRFPEAAEFRYLTDANASQNTSHD